MIFHVLVYIYTYEIYMCIYAHLYIYIVYIQDINEDVWVMAHLTPPPPPPAPPSSTVGRPESEILETLDDAMALAAEAQPHCWWYSAVMGICPPACGNSLCNDFYVCVLSIYPSIDLFVGLIIYGFLFVYLGQFSVCFILALQLPDLYIPLISRCVFFVNVGLRAYTTGNEPNSSQQLFTSHYFSLLLPIIPPYHHWVG